MRILGFLFYCVPFRNENYLFNLAQNNETRQSLAVSTNLWQSTTHLPFDPPMGLSYLGGVENLYIQQSVELDECKFKHCTSFSYMNYEHFISVY